jgi:hypothetical protein
MHHLISPSPEAAKKCSKRCLYSSGKELQPITAEHFKQFIAGHFTRFIANHNRFNKITQ